MNKKSKRLCIVANAALAVWFFLDMFGFSVGGFILVEAAWKDIDGVWYLIYIGLFALFCLKEKIGKYALSVFLLAWFVIQFSSHWYYTIFSATESKIAGYNSFFADTYKLIPASNSIVIPDLYHIVLHILILTALIFMVSYCCITRRNRR